MCRRRTTVPRPPPAPPCSATDRQPRQPEEHPPRPRGPYTAQWRRVLLDCASLSGGHGVLRGEAPGAADHARSVRRAPPPQARRGRQRPAPQLMLVHRATALLRWCPASLPPPRREGPPVPDRDTPLQSGRDGGPGHAGPRPDPRHRVCIVCYFVAHAPFKLTRRKDPSQGPPGRPSVLRTRRPPRRGMP